MQKFPKYFFENIGNIISMEGGSIAEFPRKKFFFGPLFSLGILKKSKSVFLGMKLDVCKLNSNLSEVKNLSV